MLKSFPCDLPYRPRESNSLCKFMNIVNAFGNIGDLFWRCVCNLLKKLRNLLLSATKNTCHLDGEIFAQEYVVCLRDFRCAANSYYLLPCKRVALKIFCRSGRLRQVPAPSLSTAQYRNLP